VGVIEGVQVKNRVGVWEEVGVGVVGVVDGAARGVQEGLGVIEGVWLEVGERLGVAVGREARS
jgi:hypothetical protein